MNPSPILILLENLTLLQKAIFCAFAAHVPKRTLALRFSNITFFAGCKILNQNEYSWIGVRPSPPPTCAAIMGKSEKDSDIADKPFTQKEWDSMGPWMRGIEGMPPEMQAAVRNFGRPRLEHPKEKVTVRLDHDVLVALRSKGRGWQTRLNALVQTAIAEGRL